MSETAMPPVVSAAEWAAARAELLVAEKEATRTLDRIAAQRRRLLMVRFGEYTFTSTDGPVTLRELFGEHRQLALYQFMDAGPDAFCGGCTYFTENVANLDGLARNDIAWATVSDMPVERARGLLLGDQQLGTGRGPLRGGNHRRHRCLGHSCSSRRFCQ